ncbi:MAG: hypothetical protein H6807_09505 [Planctomycetes bacterium]|nr:hypothetical protein [Planctomycetota bacterium]
MTEELDLLMERALAGELDGAGWDLIEAKARLAPETLRRFFDLARDRAELQRLVGPVLDDARGAALPSARRRAPLARVAAVAALFLIALGLGFLQGRGGRPEPTAPQGDRLAAGEHLARYLEQGREEGSVLYELPIEVVEARGEEKGVGIDVFYLRRILERRRSEEVLTLERDELGRPYGRLVVAGELPRERSF